MLLSALCSHLECPLWEKPATMLWGNSSSTVERPMCWGTEVSCQQPGEWGTLDTDFLTSVKPSGDCNLCLHLDHNLMRDSEPKPPSYMTPRHCLTPKLYELINVWSFKLLKFWGDFFHSPIHLFWQRVKGKQSRTNGFVLGNPRKVLNKQTKETNNPT